METQSNGKRPYSKKMTITPEYAQRVLTESEIFGTRSITASHVHTLARAMLNNRFYLTCQGIGFDINKNLKDGWHRFLACILAQKSFVTFAMFNLPKESFIYGTDCGKKRSPGGGLEWARGVKKGNQWVAIMNKMVNLINGDDQRVDPALAILMYDLYDKEIERVLSLASNISRLKVSQVLAPMVFGMALDPEKTEKFEVQYFTGEGITRKDPAFRLREYMLTDYRQMISNRSKGISRLAMNALKHHIMGIEMTKLYRDDEANDFFFDNQKFKIKKIVDFLKIRGENMTRRRKLTIPTKKSIKSNGKTKLNRTTTRREGREMVLSH